MSIVEKRLQRLKNGDELPWDKLQTILISYGFMIKSAKGSHFKIFKEGTSLVLFVPVHSNSVKTIYIKKIVELIETIESFEDDE